MPLLAPWSQTIQLVSADGAAVLGYSGLRAWDATCRTLPSRLAMEAGHMRLVVDDVAATYPVAVTQRAAQRSTLEPNRQARGYEPGRSAACLRAPGKWDP
jgi:hypothetical protein